jgi:serine/threonine-protein kinase ULK/ATG1
VGAMHRDFKAANILLHNGVAKIADLGFAKILKNQVVTGTILGTSVTMAPELLENKTYGVECDIWSVGVVYYQFLTGDYPYTAINDMEILKKIKKGPPIFPPKIPISKESMDFILRCLTIDPKKRITWKAIY